MRAKITQIW